MKCLPPKKKAAASEREVQQVVAKRVKKVCFPGYFANFGERRQRVYRVDFWA